MSIGNKWIKTWDIAVAKCITYYTYKIISQVRNDELKLGIRLVKKDFSPIGTQK